MRNGISPMPSSLKARQTILNHLPQTEGVIYELGSGWGTLALPVAAHYNQQQVIGFETSPVPLLISQIFCRRPNLTYKRKNFFNENLNDASLIICYLYPGAMRELKQKFQDELKPGTSIITNTFAIPGWEPKEVWEVNDLYKTKIYRYER